jgi:hypothetical protein
VRGGDAQALWRKFEARHSEAAKRYDVVPTYHTSRQAFIGSREVREARLADLREKFAAAAGLLATAERRNLCERVMLLVLDPPS